MLPLPQRKSARFVPASGKHLLRDSRVMDDEETYATTLGFIVLRCVQKKTDNALWNNCCDSIRRNYPECKIIVIDDHSKDDLVSCMNSANAEVVHSGVSTKAGEMLPYYYYHQMGDKWFDRAVIVHDSTVVQSRFPVPETEFVPLWHFLSTDASLPLLEKRLIGLLGERTRVPVQDLHEDKTRWLGCFGAMSIVSCRHLRRSISEQELHTLVNSIRDRLDRMACEGVIPCVMLATLIGSTRRPGVFGGIGKHPSNFELTPEVYLRNSEPFRRLPVVKLWCRR